MVRKYKRKTNRKSSVEQLDAAYKDVKENGMKIKSSAKKHGVDRMTLSR